MHSKNNQSFKKDLSTLIFFSLVIFLTGCGNSEDAEKVKAALEINTLNITSLEITNPTGSTIETTATEQFTAMAIIANGTEEPINITDKVKWSSSDTASATISSSGLLSPKALVSATVTVNAQLADLSASKEIKLSDAQLESINILNNPSPVSVCRGNYQLTAEGKYESEPGEEDDIRPITADKLTWSSDTPETLSIDDTGVFSTFKNGTAIITASSNSIESTASVTINDDIDSIAITTSSDTVFVGSTLNFTATGTYDDTSTAEITKNVNWISDTPAALSISNDAGTKGVATGVTKDLANISATCLSASAEVSNSVLISVEEPPVVNGVSINEDMVSLEFKIIDSPEQLVAKLKRSDGSFSTLVTDDDNTDWSIKRTISGTELTLSNTKGSKGEISFTAVGITVIEVRYDDNDTGLGPFYDEIEVEVLAN